LYHELNLREKPCYNASAMNLEDIYHKALHNEQLSAGEAAFVIKTPDEEIYELLALANKIKNKYQGKKVILCGIINAKAGKCSENCSFCAQSSHHQTKTDTYTLKPEPELVKAAVKAKADGAGCFSLVTSGKKAPEGEEFDDLKESVIKITENGGLNRCASLGLLTKEQAVELKASGLNKYHHNLETAESFFPNMCSTHTYKERVETIKNVQSAGLDVCCGGIFGIGENEEQRVELALAIRDLDIASIPLNILNPIAGTKIYNNSETLTPLEILKLIAMFRFVNPTKIIGLFGGREINLRSLQPLAFASGCNSILIGNYLTVDGRESAEDIQMIKDLGLEYSREH